MTSRSLELSETMSNLVGFQQMVDNVTLEEDDEGDSDEDLSDFQLEAQRHLPSFISDKSSANTGRFLNINSADVNGSGNNYFSFHNMHSNDLKPIRNNTGHHGSLIDSDPLYDSGRSHTNSPIAHLPQTDFAPRKGIFENNGYESWFELFRVKYLLYLGSFLSFVAIITFFLAPRPIDAWIEITVQKLQFPSDSEGHFDPKGNLSMIITGHLYVNNPNYLPITFESMKMDIYFNHTTVSSVNSNDSICEMVYLLSFTNSWNELQNEQIYNVDYPFYVTLEQEIGNETINYFKEFVTSSCKDSGSFVIRAHIYPRYIYTETERQIAFFTDTQVNQGCPTNSTLSAGSSSSLAVVNAVSDVKRINTAKMSRQLIARYSWIEDIMSSSDS